MHFHFVSSASEALWTLSFAAELVLLVVLLGRDLVRRFPLFTLSIALGVLIGLIGKLLLGRIAPAIANTVFLASYDAAALVGILVAIELARRAFQGASSWAWNVGVGLAILATAAVMAFWGPWPAWRTLAGHSTIATMRDMQMIAGKGGMLYDLLYVELGLAVVLFGRRFGAGWRSHPRMIAIGLSTVALSQLAMRLIWQLIAMHTVVHSRAEYERVMGLRERIFNANSAVYLCVLVWWIAWLWLDERGARAKPGTSSSRAAGKRAAETSRA